MRNRISMTLAALALCSGVSGAHAASLSWVFDVPYLCNPDCWGSGSAKATVSDGTGSQAGSLVFSIDLNPLGTDDAFMNKDVASFTFALQPGISGVTISDINGNGPHAWTPLYDITNLARPHGPWTGGLTYDADVGAAGKQQGANGSTLDFTVSANTALALGDLARFVEYNWLPIYFSAEIAATGGIAHIGACAPWGTGGCGPLELVTPIPSTLVLFASGTSMLGLMAFRRKRTRRKAA